MVIPVPETFLLPAGPEIPNNQVLPILVYRQILSGEDRAGLFEKHFIDNHWQGLWRNGIYDYHHFHSRAHEVLGIAHGICRIQLGGLGGGRTVEAKAGDMIVLPAGTGHKDHGSDDDLVVIGAYPPGQIMDICKSLKDCPQALKTIAATPLPVTDPFYGTDGPLPQLWEGK